MNPEWVVKLLAGGPVALAAYNTIWRLLQPWEGKRLAKAKVEADLIAAKGAIDAKGIEIVGEARLQRLRGRLAASSMATPSLGTGGGVAVHAEPDPFAAGAPPEVTQRLLDAEHIGDRVFARMVFEQLSAQHNLDEVVRTMLRIAPPPGDPNGKEPSEAWKNQFANVAGANATDDETRVRYAKLLAGEIVQPGRFAMTTLDVVSRLSSTDVAIFERAIPFTLDDGVIIVESKVFHETSGVSYNELLRLDECGLVHRNLQFVVRNGREQPPWESTIGALDKKLVLRRRTGPFIDPTFGTAAHVMTQAGAELRRLNEHKLSDKFIAAFIAFMNNERYDVTVIDA